MPIKKTPNQLNLKHVSNSHVLNFFTYSKKAHFEVNEGKLYDSLQYCLTGINVNYQVHLTTYPFIAVHVVYGGKIPDDEQHIEKVRQTIEILLQSYLKKI